MSEILFATIGGLRGAVSLILTQVVVTEQNPDPTLANRKVTAEVRPRLSFSGHFCTAIELSICCLAPSSLV
jgi:hypothetical protein